jgi:hypothetical protein
MKKNIYLCLFFFIFSSDAQAYLDPASGSAILYIILSVASAGIFFLRDSILKIYYFLLTKFKFKHNQNKNYHQIVFYSEGRQYWNVFYPILKELEKSGERILFLTSDKKDPAFNHNFSNVTVNYIGSSHLAGVYLNQISAKFLGMTTPQLDVLTIKKSKKVKHYAHIVHAPVDVATYRKFAFDYFDSVFCSGPHQIKSMRYFEEKRNTPKKKLLEVGCTYYDKLLEDKAQFRDYSKIKPTILIAPTWKNYSIIHSEIFNVLNKLLENNRFTVILRPHPQTYVSYPQIMTYIEKTFSHDENFVIDNNTSPMDSMSRCDLLISDLSGIIWDYVFLFERPVLLIQKEMNFDGFEATEMNFPFWDLEALSKIGKKVEIKELENIEIIVNDFIQNSKSLNLEEFRTQNIYNWGKAGTVAANEILNIVNLK